MSINNTTRVLFVCMGNICRSPTAEGVFRHQVEQAGLTAMFETDSAGTHAYHVGEPPDHRAVAAADRRGISLAGLQARRVVAEDFERYDYILAMDEENLQRLQQQRPASSRAQVQLFLEYADAEESEVPDPYYGGAAGFEHVLDLIEDASRGLLGTLSSQDH